MSPSCFSCTCGVAPDRMFVIGVLAFTWELEAGLIPVPAKEIVP